MMIRKQNVTHQTLRRSSDGKYCSSWWRHQMETFSTLLPLCAGKSPIPGGELPAQRQVTLGFGVPSDMHLNERLSKQWWGCCFNTPSRQLWRCCNACGRSTTVECRAPFQYNAHFLPYRHPHLTEKTVVRPPYVYVEISMLLIWVPSNGIFILTW